MIKSLRYSGIILKMISPTALKREVPAVKISADYNWTTQRSTDVLKWGTGGNTSQFSPGQIFNDSDSWSD